MKHVKIKSKKGLNGWTAEFTIGVQTFSLGDLGTKERADWYCKQLSTAFETFTNKILDNAIPSKENTI